MIIITDTLINEIHRHHLTARRGGRDAENHARKAGDLLLQAKSAISAGWLNWVEAKICFPVRQVQRYMALARGTIQKQGRAPTQRTMFIPQMGKFYFTSPDGSGGDSITFVVEPSLELPGSFFVSRFYDLDLYTFTRHPVLADRVEESLQFCGLEDPTTATWMISHSDGVLVALETFSCQETNERSIQREKNFVYGRLKPARFG